jgi:hypothetical protein
MSRSPTGPIEIMPTHTVDGEPVIEARVTLSEETWRALLVDENVGMFEADTLANRMRNFLFWAVIAPACEAADADEIAGSIAQAEADHEVAQMRRLTTRPTDDADDDIPF